MSNRLGSWGAKLAVWLLKKNLSSQDRSLLINAILDKLAMLPMRSIIQVTDDGSLIIRGRKLDPEEQNLLHESAKALYTNRAFRLIQDEVLYTAMTYAVNHTTNFEQMYSSKMAVWWGMQENKFLNLLSASDKDPDLPRW